VLYPKPIRKPKPRRRSRTDLRTEVLIRDGGCLLRTLGYPGHECIGMFETPIHRDAPATGPGYTLEHVPAAHGPSDVRRDDPAHCVGLCYGTNVKPPSSDEREVMRRHLRGLFPACPELATMFSGDGDG